MSLLIDIFNYTKEISAPLLKKGIHSVIQTAYQAGFQNDRVGKVVAGVGFIGGGVSLFKASCASKMSLIKRVAVGAIGVAATIYGVYQLTCGVTEITAPPIEGGIALPAGVESETCENPLAAAPISAPPLPDFLDVCREDHVVCGEDPYHRSVIRSTVNRLMECPESRPLWEQVKREGPFTIRCNSDTRFGQALTLVKEREIWIATKHLFELPSAIIMELKNLASGKYFSALDSQACQLSSEEYAERIEKREYVNLQETHGILRGCIQRDVFHPSTDLLKQHLGEGGKLSTFEGYLDQQRSSGHTDFYVRKHARLCTKGWAF